MTDNPTPCDCCHADGDGWASVPLTVEALEPVLQDGATVRLLTHALGVDGRLHLAAAAQGVLEGGVATDGVTVEGVALMPDPEADGLGEAWKVEAKAALQRRRDALAAGQEPGRELWGPLVVGQHVLQVQVTA